MKKNCTAVEVAKFVITRCIDNGTPISNLQLQKILYYIQAGFLKKLKYSAFNEDILAWKHGPVIPEVYYTFNSYVASCIEKRYDIDIELDEKEEKIINDVILEKANLNAWDLVEMTHEEDPWKDTYEENQNKIISKKKIKQYFENIIN